MRIGQEWVDVTDHLVAGQVIQVTASVALLFVEKATIPVAEDEEEALRISNAQFLNYTVPSGGRRSWVKNYGAGEGHIRSGVIE